MDMQGNRHLAVTQQQAWEALNDPEVLKACIPGCDRVEATGENQYAIGMAVKIGPVSARFSGKILLADVLPPSSYTLNFEGQGECDNGRHEMKSAGNFGVTVWGWGSAESNPFSTQYVSYAYPAGASVQPINDVVVVVK